MNLTLKEVYSVFKKDFGYQKDKYINNISIDTRTIRHGDIFFAIKGENTDGHNYIKDAFLKGAVLVVSEKNKGDRIINVDDTKKALLKLASFYINKFKNINVFAITGSNGKTTVKEVIYRILTCKFKDKFVLKSQKSFNNIIGVPLTIFNLNNNHKVAVLEIGMNRPGEIKEIMDLIKIDVAIITNIGIAHIGLLKSKDKIAKAKSEIFYGLKRGGMVVLNRDDEYYGFLLKRARKIVKNLKIISFGLSDSADLKISNICNYNQGLVFNLNIKNRTINIETGLSGKHNAYNIAAAVAASFYTDTSLLTVKKAMKNFKLKNMMRLEKKYVNGITIIQDCYNANPDSFKTALEFLKEEKFKNIIAIIGDMYELGVYTKKFHNYIGSLFKEVELKKLIVTGKYADYYNQGFIKAGGDEKIVKIFGFNKKREISNYLSGILEKGDTLFLKGSRKNKLEEILNNLKFLYKRR